MTGVTHIWDFGGKNILVIRDLKKGRLISGWSSWKALQGRCINRKWLHWDHGNYICPKVTNEGSIICHRIDYKGVVVMTNQRHIHSKNWPKHPPPAFPRVGSLEIDRLISLFQAPRVLFSLCSFYIRTILSESLAKATDSWEAKIVQYLRIGLDRHVFFQFPFRLIGCDK